MVTCEFPSERPTNTVNFSMLLPWTNRWTNNRCVSDLRRHEAHVTLLYWSEKIVYRRMVNLKITIVAISRSWRNVVFRNCRFDFRRHQNVIWVFLEGECVSVFLFLFENTENATVYLVCASALWFITIKTANGSIRRNALAKDVMYFSSIFSTVEVWEWITNFIPHFLMDLITYPCWDQS